jgi:hypothetical protein
MIQGGDIHEMQDREINDLRVRFLERDHKGMFLGGAMVTRRA